MAETIDIAAMRTRLEQLRQEYQAQIDDMLTGEEVVVASDPGHDGDISDDEADDADALFDAERDLALVENARNQIELVDGALARIEAGTYGICMECGKQIDLLRLEAVPYAQYCLEDQIKHEQ